MPELGQFRRPVTHPPTPPLDQPLNIGLRMQYQQTSEWCWIAVATSIDHFYNPSSTTTQCELMTIVGQTINEFPLSSGACPDPAVVAANPNLASRLADPHDPGSLYVLDGLVSPAYLKSGGVADALDVNDNFNGPGLMSLAEITAEINALRPIAVDIRWNSGGEHCVAIAGVYNDTLLICDPANGESFIDYASFPGAYGGGATIQQLCLTRAGYSPSSAEWSPEQQGVGVGSSNGPTLVEFNGELYAAWKGVPGDTRMFWSSFDGANWSPEQQGVGVGSSDAPSLAVFNGRVYAAWKGIPGDTRMFWSSFDGRSWSTEQPGVGVGSSDGPSLAVFNGKLYAAWKGVPGDTRMFWSSFDGSNWSSEQKLSLAVGTSVRPTLAVFNGQLYAAWKSVPNDNRMFLSVFDGTSTWSPARRGIGVGSSDSPSLAVLGSRLFAAWKGVPSDTRMFWSVFEP